MHADARTGRRRRGRTAAVRIGRVVRTIGLLARRIGPVARRFGPLTAVTAVVGLTVALLLAPFAGAPSAEAMGPLPACRYDDILTAPRSYDDWPTTQVDTILGVGSTYAPRDLVSVSTAGIAGSGKVRAVLVDDLAAMTAAAKAAGSAIGVESAYRSYASQQAVFQGWVRQLGYRRALEVSARPGHSEHQLGLAIDFRSDPGGSPFTGDWATTPAGTWMLDHAWEYGFVLSYPKGAIRTVCYDYEPWHYRYVGRTLGAEVHASGLTLRAYLWSHFTTALVPPPSAQPAATHGTATPAPTALPSGALPSGALPSAGLQSGALPSGGIASALASLPVELPSVSNGPPPPPGVSDAVPTNPASIDLPSAPGSGGGPSPSTGPSGPGAPALAGGADAGLVAGAVIGGGAVLVLAGLALRRGIEGQGHRS